MAENWKEDWDKRIKEFSEKTKKDVTEVENALVVVVGEASEDALANLSDVTLASDKEIQDAFAALKIPSAVFKKNVGILRGPKPETPAVDTATVSEGIAQVSVLPEVPRGESILTLLKVGGELKSIDDVDVVSAASTALAARLNIFDLPEVILEKMENFMENEGETCGPDFYEIFKAKLQRNYAEAGAAWGITGIGNLMSKARKDRLLKKLDESFWTTIYDFDNILKAWVDQWNKTGMNPSALMAAIGNALSGGAASGLPALMMRPPDTSRLRAAAEGANDKINKIFAGTGKMVNRGLALDVQRIKKILETPDLARAMGYASKESMLKNLNIAITSDYELLDKNIGQYALALMRYPKVESGKKEQLYLTEMWDLGNAIPWEALTRGTGDSKGNDPFGKKGNVRV